MSKSSYLTADLNYICRNVDWQKVNDAIETTPGYQLLTDPDKEEAKELVWELAESFLARDLQEFEEIKIEERCGDGRAFLDLQGLMRGTMAPYDKFAGYWEICDYKTTSEPVDTEKWRNKCLDSWQHKWYAALKPDARFFTYRGISRERVVRTEKEGWYEAQRIREIRIELNPGMATEVRIQKAGVMTEYNALLASGLEIWPRNTHTGCAAWGGKCPHIETCHTNQMPLGTPGMEPLEDLSFSRMSTIMLCKERARRNKLAELEGDTDMFSSGPSIIGNAVHAGVGSLWLEAFRTR